MKVNILEGRIETYFWDNSLLSASHTKEDDLYTQEDNTAVQSIDRMQPFGFTGYERDDISGLYYAQAKRYDAQTGRFTSRDMIKGQVSHMQSQNEYAYCLGNPLLYVDRGGKTPTPVYFLIVGIIEIFVCILWRIKRKRIEKEGMYTDALILADDIIIGKPNRYCFQVEFYDFSNKKKTAKIMLNGNTGKRLQQTGKIPIIYMESSDKIYLQKTDYGEMLLCIIIIILTFIFAFLCLK